MQKQAVAVCSDNIRRQIRAAISVADLARFGKDVGFDITLFGCETGRRAPVLSDEISEPTYE